MEEITAVQVEETSAFVFVKLSTSCTLSCVEARCGETTVAHEYQIASAKESTEGFSFDTTTEFTPGEYCVVLVFDTPEAARSISSICVTKVKVSSEVEKEIKLLSENQEVALRLQEESSEKLKTTMDRLDEQINVVSDMFSSISSKMDEMMNWMQSLSEMSGRMDETTTSMKCLPDLSSKMDEVTNSMKCLSEMSGRVYEMSSKMECLPEMTNSMKCLPEMTKSMKCLPEMSDRMDEMTSSMKCLPEMTNSMKCLPEMTKSMDEMTKSMECLPEMSMTSLPKLLEKVESMEESVDCMEELTSKIESISTSMSLFDTLPAKMEAMESKMGCMGDFTEALESLETKLSADLSAVGSKLTPERQKLQEMTLLSVEKKLGQVLERMNMKLSDNSLDKKLNSVMEKVDACQTITVEQIEERLMSFQEKGSSYSLEAIKQLVEENKTFHAKLQEAEDWIENEMKSRHRPKQSEAWEGFDL